MALETILALITGGVIGAVAGIFAHHSYIEDKMFKIRISENNKEYEITKLKRDIENLEYSIEEKDHENTRLTNIIADFYESGKAHK